ncbi:DUF4352 domain-containing protein [Bacillus sp. BGMRC 2118]|nr:DUF4352 domain-containing protein [Bacillus sp. BGMRC 2118]
MKKLFNLIWLSLLFVSVMTACTEDKTDSAVEKSSTEKPVTKKENEDLLNFEQDDESRLEQGILLVGESAKGGYFLSTVHSAYLDGSNHSVIVNVSIKNVRGKIIGLSEFKYTLKDEKEGKSYEGKVLDQNTSNIQLKPDETVELKIDFEVLNPKNEYMFYIESSVDAQQALWRIDNLQSPQN